jgi:hypothetical protein
MFNNLYRCKLENSRCGKPQKLIRAMCTPRSALITFNDQHGLFAAHLVLNDSFAALLKWRQISERRQSLFTMQIETTKRQFLLAYKVLQPRSECAVQYSVAINNVVLGTDWYFRNAQREICIARNNNVSRCLSRNHACNSLISFSTDQSISHKHLVLFILLIIQGY